MNETWWVSHTQLDEEQRKVIALSPKDSLLLLGPPGSGKTNLLVLRAAYLARVNIPNFEIISFTDSLRSFIASGVTKHGIPKERIKTVESWKRSILYEHDVRVPRCETFEETRTRTTEALGKLVKAERIGKRFQTLLVDEVQDLLPEEVDLILQLADTVYAVGDIRQKIYSTGGANGSKSSPAIQRLAKSSLQVITLKHHYRIGSKICKFADALRRDDPEHVSLEDYCQYKEKVYPSSVEAKRGSDRQDLAKRLIEELSAQVKSYPDELIGVITPKRDELSTIGDWLKTSPLASEVMVQSGEGLAFATGKHVIVCTAHSAKGCEFRCANLVFAEDYRRFALQKNLVYMSATRCKTSLRLFHVAALPGYLDEAIAKVNPTQGAVSLADLFDGGEQ